jgi:hypothetical protein
MDGPSHSFNETIHQPGLRKPSPRKESIAFHETQNPCIGVLASGLRSAGNIHIFRPATHPTSTASPTHTDLQRYVILCATFPNIFQKHPIPKTSFPGIKHAQQRE